jgi:hypothetical protein
MIWSKIISVLKRLDNCLSDAVYLHGCYLTGQEKIVRRDRKGEAGNDFQHPDMKQMQAHRSPGR